MLGKPMAFKRPWIGCGLEYGNVALAAIEFVADEPIPDPAQCLRCRGIVFKGNPALRRARPEG